MSEVIGALLPLALGVAISPVPIIAAILMLLSPHARSTSVGFLIGWVAGIAAATVIFVLLVSVAGLGSTGDPSTAASWVKLLLGVLLLLLGVMQWRKRPKDGETAALPGWMNAVDKMTPAKSLGLGFLLSALNPKNLTMCVAAGLEIGGVDELGTDEIVLAIVIFVVLAASTVALPVVCFLVAQDRMRTPLNRLRDWLVQNNATVMTVLLAVIGVVMIGKGIGGLG